MSTSAQWEKQAEDIKAQYEAAVASQDPDAPMPEPITEAETAEKKKELVSIQTINKHMVFVMKKALSWAAKSVGASFGTDPVVDFLVSMQGIEMPPTGQAVVIDKLNDVLHKLKGIQEQQQKLLVQISDEIKFQVVLNAKHTIWQIWEDIKEGIRLHDEERVYGAIVRIKSDNVALKLTSMHGVLTSPEFSHVEPVVVTLQIKFQEKLLDTRDYDEDHNPHANFNYDVLKYEADVLSWRKQFVDVERMGTALLLLHEQCRDPKSSYDKAGTRDAILETSKSRIAKIDGVLLNRIRPWPSYKAISELAQVDLDKDFPRLWSLKVPDTDKVMVMNEKFYNPGNSGGGGFYVPTFTDMKRVDYQQITNWCFGLEHKSEGTWNIRCTRNLLNQYDSLPFTNWGTLSNDGKDQVLSNRSLTSFKLIPVEHASDTLITLVGQREDQNKKNNDYVSIRKLQLVPTTIPYPVLGENTDENTNRFRSYMDKQSKSKNWFSVRNGTRNYVMVLNNIVSEGTYYYQNTVWLPDEDRMCIGAYGSPLGGNVRSAFRFTLYSIPDLQGKSLQDRVKELFCLMPRSGKPGLHPSGAKAECHLIIRTHVKTILDNNVAVVELPIGDANAEFEHDDYVRPKGLWEALSKQKAFQNQDKEVWGRLTRSEIRIGKTTAPVGHVRVYDR